MGSGCGSIPQGHVNVKANVSIGIELLANNSSSVSTTKEASMEKQNPKQNRYINYVVNIFATVKRIAFAFVLSVTLAFGLDGGVAPPSALGHFLI